MKLADKFILFVPQVKETQIIDVLNEMTRLAGGVTITDANGKWFDQTNKSVWDELFLYQWNFNDDPVHSLLRQKLIHSLLNTGESAVMSEEYINGSFAAYVSTNEDVIGVVP